ncbi:MAG: CHAT domain-containing protein [Chloroflexota bacterium]|nr:CHAT domain-containing protein [Chloroflexota bacterium]MDQ5867945.1 CHAT domain-containing protein [Chloroflexota bacterium]
MSSTWKDINYLNFDITIQRAGSGYRAHLHSQSGENVTVTFPKPFSDMELENFLLKAGYSRRNVRRIDTVETAAAKEFGGKLFNTIFKGDAQECLRRDLSYAQQQDARLRLRLSLTETPELADLPWEYLYNPANNKFLALSVETPVVRYLELRDRIAPLTVNPPLRVLMMVSSPSDYAALDTEAEAKNLHGALADLEARGLVEIETMEDANLSALQRKLRRGEYHIFHFIGHGGYDHQTEQGVLILEDEHGRGRAVSGQDLGMLLHDHRCLRLAILNACEGGRADRKDPFAGTAQSLLQQGIPAVIAMQFEITDDAAIAFAHEFYEALSDNYPVDAALTEARKSLFGQGRGLEWGTPVLYLRAPNGRIFDVQRSIETDKPRVAATPRPTQPVQPRVEEKAPAEPKPMPVVSTAPVEPAEPVQRSAQIEPQPAPQSQAANTTQSQVQALYSQAQAAVAAGNWGVALQLWQGMLALEPNNPQARGGFEYSQKQAQLSAAFEDGKAHYSAGRLQQAIDAFNWVRTTAGSNYKGVDGYIAQAQNALASRQAQVRQATPPAHQTGPQPTVPTSQVSPPVAHQPTPQAATPTTTAATTHVTSPATPPYNQAATPAAPAKQGSNTMMIVVVAVLATIVVGFLLCAALGAMVNSSTYGY